MEINLTGCTSSSYHHPSLFHLLQDFAVQRSAGAVFGVGQVLGDPLIKRRILGHFVCQVPIFVNFPNGAFHEEIISNVFYDV